MHTRFLPQRFEGLGGSDAAIAKDVLEKLSGQGCE
jgi:hypothetical protein